MLRIVVLLLVVASGSTLLGGCASRAERAPGRVAEEPAPPAIVPAPRALAVGGGVFRIGPDARILVESDRRADVAAAFLLRDAIREATGRVLAILRATGGRAAPGSLVLTPVGADPRVGREGYELFVTFELVTLRALDSRGLVNGVQTIRQLLPHPREARDRTAPAARADALPVLTIADLPRQPVRRFRLREELDHPSMLELVDLLAFHKLNGLVLAPQGDLVAALARPRTGPGRLSRGELEELARRAEARAIGIVPEIDVSRVLTAVSRAPELACEDGGRLCPGREGTAALVVEGAARLDALLGGPVHVVPGADRERAADREPAAALASGLALAPDCPRCAATNLDAIASRVVALLRDRGVPVATGEAAPRRGDPPPSSIARAIRDGYDPDLPRPHALVAQVGARAEADWAHAKAPGAAASRRFARHGRRLSHAGVLAPDPALPSIPRSAKRPNSAPPDPYRLRRWKRGHPREREATPASPARSRAHPARPAPSAGRRDRRFTARKEPRPMSSAALPWIVVTSLLCLPARAGDAELHVVAEARDFEPSLERPATFVPAQGKEIRLDLVEYQGDTTLVDVVPHGTLVQYDLRAPGSGILCTAVSTTSVPAPPRRDAKRATGCRTARRCSPWPTRTARAWRSGSRNPRWAPSDRGARRG